MKDLLGCTDPITVKFANVPSVTKSVVGLPLAPSYLSSISAPQQPILSAVSPIRQQLNRYRYAAKLECSSEVERIYILCIYVIFYSSFFVLQNICFVLIILHREIHERSKYR